MHVILHVILHTKINFIALFIYVRSYMTEPRKSGFLHIKLGDIEDTIHT